MYTFVMHTVVRILINTILVLASISLTILALELLLHLTQLQYKYVSAQAPRGYFHFDPELGFDITPEFATSTHIFYDFSYPVWSNKRGCYDYEFDGSSPYLYVTGDSMAWGFAPLDDKWGKGIEKLLGIRALTCGVNGFGIRQELIKARRELAELPQSPKVIIVSYFDNDKADDHNFPNYNVLDGYVVWGEGQCGTEALLDVSPLEATTTCNVAAIHYPPFQKFKFNLALHSVLYSMVTTKFGKEIRASLQPYLPWLSPLHPFFPWLIPSTIVNTSHRGLDAISDSPALTWELHQKNILAFKRFADSHHAKLVFVLIPDRDTLSATTTDPTWDNERVAAYLAASHINYINLWQDFYDRQKLPERSFYWDVNLHMNVAGNRFVGLMTSRYLLEHDLVRIANKKEILEKINADLLRDFPVNSD